jgi:Rrf2 family protein
VLTNKGKYGLKAMVHLAGMEPGRPALVADIAQQNNISKKFLDAILAELRNAGFVRSKKGRGGGYVLARAAHEIRVGHIIRVLDGPLAPFPCASKTAYRRCQDCADEDHCSVRLMMLEVRNSVATILDNRSLAEMRALSDIDHTRLMYHI